VRRCHAVMSRPHHEVYKKAFEERMTSKISYSHASHL